MNDSTDPQQSPTEVRRPRQGQIVLADWPDAVRPAWHDERRGWCRLDTTETTRGFVPKLSWQQPEPAWWGKITEGRTVRRRERVNLALPREHANRLWHREREQVATAIAAEIGALINSKTDGESLPSPDELAEVVLRHDLMLSPELTVEMVDPAAFMRLMGDKHLEAERGAEFADHDVAIFKLDPFIVISPKDESRGADGRRKKPPRFYVRYYDRMRDRVCMVEMDDWNLVETVAPDKYGKLMAALSQQRSDVWRDSYGD